MVVRFMTFTGQSPHCALSGKRMTQVFFEHSESEDSDQTELIPR